MPPPLRSRLGVVVTSLVVFGASCSSSATTSGQQGTTTATEVAPHRLEPHDEWGELFADADTTGTFAMREVGSDTTMVWNVERAAEPRRPASTFKILNSLIILETGVLADTEAVVPWDGIERGVAEWNRDQTLRTGIEVSAVWAYQELARQVGEGRMQEWVAGASYGNADIGGGVDEFWLSGDLRISPLEQLDFLEGLAERDLPFREEVQGAVAEILIRESGDGWTWSHKTGTALVEDPDLGWLVGMSEHDGRTFVFAMNLDLASGNEVGSQIDPRVRQNIAREILRAEGALPA